MTMATSFKSILLIFISFIAFDCGQQLTAQNEGIQIAFMADVHLQDVYGEFQDSDYKGALNPGNSKFVLARTMQAQLNSTRIFNENYFAFLAALDDVVRRNVKYVVLPGDFSDDGQPFNVRGLKKIITHYSEEYGIRFIATTGNHDPVRPFSKDAWKNDFLGEGGKSQAVMSKKGMYIPNRKSNLPDVITQDIRTMGYQEIIGILDNCGFFPQKKDLYWETPFTTYNYLSYSYNEAVAHSNLANRNYLISPFNTSVPDVSYLVEPIEDLWFLAIDANVYIPTNKAELEPDNPASYKSASIGYKNVLSHKKHLINWVKKVTAEAEKREKTLIVFSHYPMIDFNDDASEHIKDLMGDGKMQLHRVPEESVARIFADAGIRLHFGGHMHINDTGVRKSPKGNTLVNVQIPSLAAYIPAYKLLTVHSKKYMEIETIILDSVPRFKELFPLYKQEHDYLESIKAKNIWDKNILSAKTYHEFTNWHLKELVRFRFLQNDWPVEFRDFLLNATGKNMLDFSLSTGTELPTEITDFNNWTGFDMIFDFYRLRSADKLAIADIGLQRIQQYQLIIESFVNSDETVTATNSTIQRDFRKFATILHHFLNGAPANHFQVNLKTGEIKDVAKR